MRKYSEVNSEIVLKLSKVFGRVTRVVTTISLVLSVFFYLIKIFLDFLIFISKILGYTSKTLKNLSGISTILLLFLFVFVGVLELSKLIGRIFVVSDEPDSDETLGMTTFIGLSIVSIVGYMVWFFVKNFYTISDTY